eukprot:GHVP01012055.1.p1 GENE.GHVP01012055.1~~GHVP01012055.1.p1  ORF type:complete len:326 (-),score=47.22 GHVP01012055.1:271-1248(-)
MIQLLVLIMGGISSVSTWRVQAWNMKNGHQLTWKAGLSRIDASSRCDAPKTEAEFFASCMSVFKATDDYYPKAATAVCRINKPGAIRFKKSLHPYIRQFRDSCGQMEELASSAFALSVRLILAATLGLLSLISLGVHAYTNFQNPIWFTCGMGSSVVAFGVEALLVIRSFLDFNKVNSIFDYSHLPDVPIAPHSGSFGMGFWLAVVALLGQLLVSCLWSFFVPMFIDIDALPRKKRAKKSQKETDAKKPKKESQGKELLWGLVPRALQKEVGNPEYEYLGDSNNVEFDHEELCPCFVEPTGPCCHETGDCPGCPHCCEQCNCQGV